MPGTNQKKIALNIIFFFFLLLFPQHNFFFPLCSMGTQLHIHVYILLSPIIMLHGKKLEVVLSATQQDLIANPFHRQ